MAQLHWGCELEYNREFRSKQLFHLFTYIHRLLDECNHLNVFISSKDSLTKFTRSEQESNPHIRISIEEWNLVEWEWLSIRYMNWYSLDWKEGLTKLKFVCLSVCLSVTGSKEHCRLRYELWDVLMLSGVNRCRELESEVRFPRTTMVARQPVYPDVTEIGFPGGFETWGTRIGSQFPWKTHWSAGN